MKRKNIVLNVLFFLLGIFVWFIIDLIWDWEGNVEDFNKGYNKARENYTEEPN